MTRDSRQICFQLLNKILQEIFLKSPSDLQIYLKKTLYLTPLRKMRRKKRKRRRRKKRIMAKKSQMNKNENKIWKYFFFTL